MIEWRIGCSGFHYKEWRDVFYPANIPQTKWFNYYTEHFNTLELNVTFYRFPRVSSLQAWYNKSPEGFDFSVKVPRLITHYKQFNECERMLGDFYGSIREGLKEKLGCVLFQLPSRIKYSEQKFDQILCGIDHSFNNVIEFRDSSWWKKKVYSKLARNNIGFCGVSHPALPDEAIVNTPLAYYRFHGVPVLYKSTYQKKKVEEIAVQLFNSKKTKQAFVYFNNTWGTGGIKNAKQLQSIVKALSKGKI